MEIIKFSKNITEVQAKKIDIEQAEKDLEKVNIHDLRIIQGTTGQWKIHGTKRHDVDIALTNMDGDDLVKLAKEKLVIDLQGKYRNEIMTTVGLSTESATNKTIRIAKESMSSDLKSLGIADDQIEKMLINAFNK